MPDWFTPLLIGLVIGLSIGGWASIFVYLLMNRKREPSNGNANSYR